MDKEQLHALLSLAETKNFTRTAERLHITQSTVTTRIKNLEQQLGVSLFVRNNRRVELTRAGEKAISYAKRIADLIDECETTVRLEETFKDRIVIGGVHSLWDYSLGPIVKKYREENPRTAVRLITGHSFEIIQKLLDGSIDVGIVYVQPKNPDIESVHLYNDAIHLAAASTFHIGKNELVQKDLLDFSLIYLDWGESFSDWFRKEVGLQYIPELQVDHAGMLVQFLEEKKGIGFITSAILKHNRISSRINKLTYNSKTPIPERPVYMVYLKRNKYRQSIRNWSELIIKSNGG